MNYLAVTFCIINWWLIYEWYVLLNMNCEAIFQFASETDCTILSWCLELLPAQYHSLYNWEPSSYFLECNTSIFLFLSNIAAWIWVKQPHSFWADRDLPSKRRQFLSFQILHVVPLTVTLKGKNTNIIDIEHRVFQYFTVKSWFHLPRNWYT
jgi:hypothetical protein